jgi:hypothetical protein
MIKNRQLKRAVKLHIQIDEAAHDNEKCADSDCDDLD